ncbi:hypothetical protein D9611_002025 [Ephemerocybe angulata]|uniref:Uncharacterized protein n=1 Tax=Ephemerocybe angulata TaxID=980116 RepID=A0A8H5CJ15_9AGAR|nr:hypothetical protein D9611_002025 [Tulosesus angulatus]
MLQRIPSALRRAALLFTHGRWCMQQHIRFSGSSNPTGALKFYVTHDRYHQYALKTTPTSQKTRGSISPFGPMSSSAHQHDVLPTHRQKRIVHNLDPNHLRMSDIVDLNGPLLPTVKFGATLRASQQLDYFCTKTPFPPNSRGFLYYHSRPGLPPGAGEIRFRVVDSRSASHSAADLFANGRDLLDHTGHRPWRIHMLQLYAARDYDPVRRLLLSNGLIGAAQDHETEQRVSVNGMTTFGGSTILDTISDAFVIRQLPIATLRLTLIHDECIVPTRIAQLSWRDRPETAEGSNARWREYQGAAVVRFELKKAEADKTFYGVKEGEVVLVLRILELLDPVGADGVPFRLPEEGDLIQARSPHWSWCASLDRAQRLGIITPSSLKILEELYLGDNASTEKSPPS